MKKEQSRGQADPPRFVPYEPLADRPFCSVEMTAEEFEAAWDRDLEKKRAEAMAAFPQTVESLPRHRGVWMIEIAEWIRLQEPEVADHARNMLASSSSHSDPETRISTLLALGLLGSDNPHVLPAVLDNLGSDDEATRMCAVFGLGVLLAPEPRAVSGLIHALDDSNDSIRVSAKRTLRRLLSIDKSVGAELLLVYTAMVNQIRSEGLPAYHWRSPARRHSFAAIKELLTVETPPRPVSTWESAYPAAHAKLVEALDKKKGIPKTRLRLRTLISFKKHGSFRQVAVEMAKLAGDPSDNPDHSGPISQVRKLAETLEIALTQVCDGPGQRRSSELTDAGNALAEWIESHPETFD